MPIYSAHFTLESEVSELPRLEVELDKLRNHLPHDGFTKVWLMQVHLAFHEIVTNIIKYAYAGTGGTIRCELCLFPDRLQIDLYDMGKPFDEAYTPRSYEPQHLPEGGYGLNILYRIMDVVEYERLPAQGNHWHLMRKLKHAQF